MVPLLLRVLAGLAALGLGWSPGTPATAQGTSLPRQVTIGANPPGTVFYALGSGLAKVVSGAAPFQMTVQPYGSALQWHQHVSAASE